MRKIWKRESSEKENSSKSSLEINFWRMEVSISRSGMISKEIHDKDTKYWILGCV
jgi:hypothetical protein